MNEHKTYFIALQLSLLLLLLVFPTLLLLLFLHHNTGTLTSHFQFPQPSNSAANLLFFQPFAFGSCNSVKKAAKTKNTEPLSMVIFSPTLYWQCISLLHRLYLWLCNGLKAPENNTERFVIPSNDGSYLT